RLDPAVVSEMYRAPFLQATLFLAVFMLTDPPTSPSRYADQVAIGTLAAVVAVASQLAGAGQAYLLLGVLAANAALAGRRMLPRGRSVTLPDPDKLVRLWLLPARRAIRTSASDQ